MYTETTQVFEQLKCRMFGINQEYVSFLRKFDYSWYIDFTGFFAIFTSVFYLQGKMKRISALKLWLLLAVVARPIVIFSQEKWTVSIEPQKRFIENKSQFDGRDELSGSEILYGVDWGSAQIYFTPNSLTYRFDKRKKKNETEEWKRKARMLREGKYFSEEEDDEHEVKTDVIHMEWVNASAGVRLTGLQPADDYFSYTVGGGSDVKNINRIKGYQKLIYENLYPNIDVEYSFHADGGIKYQLILHPGADISLVKMKYSGTDQVSLDAEGNARIATVFGDITDHAPLTFYADAKKSIRSGFSVSENTVSFQLGNYDRGKSIVIDPWTVTPPLPVTNKAYYIKADTSGNAYVYGGDSPYRLLKYDSTGSLIWTFLPGWSSANNWFGALAVDAAGNAYVTSGSSAIISRVDSGGGLVWSNGQSGFYEYWTLGFNCDYSQLMVGGTYSENPFSFEFHGAAFQINQGDGSIDTMAIVTNALVANPATPFGINEIRTLAASPNGSYYFLTLDTIGSIGQAFDVSYLHASSYNLSYYLPYGQGGSGQGINGIAAGKNFLYTTDGQTLHKRNIADGSILATVTIPNGSKEVNSGIAVDGCGNVYAGAVSRVHQYDADLNLIATYNTSGEVYDVSVTDGGNVLACGRGFASSINVNACAPVKPFCLVSTSQKNLECSAVCTGEGTATGMNGTPPYSYRWSDGQTSQTATNLCAGTHAVTVTDAAGDSIVTSVVITEPPAFTVAASTLYSPNCGVNGLASPAGGTPPYTYSWSNGETTVRTSGLAIGTYMVTVFDANNCTVTDSVEITNTSSFGLNKTRTSVTCGTCTGEATITPTGGIPPYTYSWSDGQTAQTATGLCGGTTYSVTVTATASNAGNIFWGEDFAAGGAGWTLNINGPGTNGNSANPWVINNDTSNCSACPSAGSRGNFLHITCNSSDFVCSASGNAGTCNYGTGFPLLFDASTDKYVSSPGISTIGKTNMTLRFWYMSEGDGTNDYGKVRLSNNGGTTWTDLPDIYSGTSACTQASVTIPAAYENIPDFRIAFRWVNNNDLDGNDPPFLVDDIEISTPGMSIACSATDTVTIAGGSALSITTSITAVICDDDQDGSIKLIPSGGTPPYEVIWSNGDSATTVSNLQPGVYSFTLTDAEGCQLDSSIALTSVSEYDVEIIATDALCDGSPTGSLQANIISGTTPPYTYLWSNGDTSDLILNLPPGSYGLTVTDELNCLRTDSARVSRRLNIEETIIPPCPSINNGSITATVTGGVQPYGYLWNTGATSQSLLGIGEGTYSLTVSDQNDCKGSDTIIVMNDTTNIAFCDTLIFYDVFSPNGDGVNEQWVVDGLLRFPDNEIQIFNRWGNLVYEAKPYSNDWDGRSKKDELLPPATYYYILKLHDLNESVYSGNITLIR